MLQSAQAARENQRFASSLAAAIYLGERRGVIPEHILLSGGS